MSTDVPGYEMEAVDISVVDNVLHITAAKSETREEDTDTFHRRERFFGKVQRSMRLPVDADHQNATASFDKGVLTLSFPKSGGEAAEKKVTIA